MADVMLDDVPVMGLVAIGGPAGAKGAFNALESKLPALRGRRFYGTYDPGTGEYRACVALQPSDNPSALGFERWVIPGGKYAREKMRNWADHIEEIGKTFIAMSDREQHRLDRSRPSIEFYRSATELILLLPVSG